MSLVIQSQTIEGRFKGFVKQYAITVINLMVNVIRKRVDRRNDISYCDRMEKRYLHRIVGYPTKKKDERKYQPK